MLRTTAMSFPAGVVTETSARIAMEFDRARYFGWMGYAAAAFLAATVVWLQLILPKMLVKASE